MFRTFSALLLLLYKFVHAEPFVRTCEPIRVEMCKGLGYNMTDESQRDAEFFILPFKPLVSFGCSVHLNLFLCSVSVPMCTEKVAYPIGPCRGLCEGVRDRCFPVLEKFGFSWPDALNCSLFPAENNHKHMCMEGPKDTREEDFRFSVDMSFQARDCPPHHARTDNSGPCVPLCDANFLFDSAEKKYAEIWVTVWAIICFVSSFIAALTLSIGGGRVKARPLVSLALCYCFVSAGWILRIITGRNMTSCLLETNPSEFHEDGLANANCAFVFLLIYYFGMAANAWWVAMCAWWLAKAGLSWPPEKLRNFGSFLHIVAWGLPAAQTVGALVKREIDIDELTGTCYVGNKNSSILLSLLLIPQALYLAFGIVLLILGSIYVMPKPQPSAAAPLTGAAPRKESDILGALSTLYIIPTACVLGSLFYEYNNNNKWFFGTEKPALWPFLLKHLMSLFVGVSTLFWLWSTKTTSAWKGVFKRMGPRKQLPVKCQIPLVTYPQNHYPQHISTTMSTASRHSTRTHPHRKPRIHHHRNEVKTII